MYFFNLNKSFSTNPALPPAKNSIYSLDRLIFNFVSTFPTIEMMFTMEGFPVGFLLAQGAGSVVVVEFDKFRVEVLNDFGHKN